MRFPPRCGSRWRVNDGTDGTFARKWEVKKYFTPNFDGRKLDDITDFLTYTFVPCFLWHQFELPGGYWRFALFAILVGPRHTVSATLPRKPTMASRDSHRIGTRSYLFVLAGFSGLAKRLILLVLAALTFAPTEFMSFNETRQFRVIDRAFFRAVGGYFVLLFREFDDPRPSPWMDRRFIRRFIFWHRSICTE
ncbi:MAG: hypothetical protein R3C26_26375 [Calditrichia bacterium]